MKDYETERTQAKACAYRREHIWNKANNIALVRTRMVAAGFSPRLCE